MRSPPHRSGVRLSTGTAAGTQKGSRLLPRPPVRLAESRSHSTRLQITNRPPTRASRDNVRAAASRSKWQHATRAPSVTPPAPSLQHSGSTHRRAQVRDSTALPAAGWEKGTHVAAGPRGTPRLVTRRYGFYGARTSHRCRPSHCTKPTGAHSRQRPSPALAGQAGGCGGVPTPGRQGWG